MLQALWRFVACKESDDRRHPHYGTPQAYNLDNDFMLFLKRWDSLALWPPYGKIYPELVLEFISSLECVMRFGYFCIDEWKLWIGNKEFNYDREKLHFVLGFLVDVIVSDYDEKKIWSSCKSISGMDYFQGDMSPK